MTHYQEVEASRQGRVEGMVVHTHEEEDSLGPWWPSSQRTLTSIKDPDHHRLSEAPTTPESIRTELDQSTDTQHLFRGGGGYLHVSPGGEGGELVRECGAECRVS